MSHAAALAYVPDFLIPGIDIHPALIHAVWLALCRHEPGHPVKADFGDHCLQFAFCNLSGGATKATNLWRAVISCLREVGRDTGFVVIAGRLAGREQGRRGQEEEKSHGTVPVLDMVALHSGEVR